MSARIHPTAIVDKSAEIAPDAEVGPYCIVGPNVKLAPGVRLVAHVFIERETEIGEATVVHPYAVLGQPAQDTSYKGEATTLVIGARNTIREHVSMHRGTVRGRGRTAIGDDGYFMAQSHEFFVFPGLELLQFQSLDRGATGLGIKLDLFLGELIGLERVVGLLHRRLIAGELAAGTGFLLREFP